MNITTDYNVISALRAGTSSASASAAPATAGSTFGPDYLLSIGDGTAATSDSGYSYLAPTAAAQRSAAVPIFDLASVLQSSPADALAAASARSPSQIKAEEAAVREAAIHLNLGELDQARAILEGVLADNPLSAVAIHAMGAVELEEHHYERAEQLFLKSHVLNPEKGYDADADNARILQKDDAQVLAHARRLVATPATRQDGIRLLVNLTNRSPLDSESRMLLAENLIREGDAVNALQQFHRAILTADNGQLGRIEAELTELVETAPQAAYLRQLLGKAQLRLRKYRAAAETLATASYLSGDSPGYKSDEALAQVGIGRDRLLHGDVTGAMSRFERARQLDADNREVKKALAEGYLARGQSLARIGSLDAAISDFRSAAQQLDADGDEVLRGQIARGAYTAGLRLEQRHEADGEEVDGEVLAFQTAYDLDGDNVVYKRKLADARVELADQYLADEDYGAAAANYARAYDLFHDDRTYRDSAVNAHKLHGNELLSQHNYDEAIEAYRNAYEINPNDGESRQGLADAFNARGLDYKSREKFTLAAADFKEALHLFPDNATYRANYNSVRNYE